MQRFCTGLNRQGAAILYHRTVPQSRVQKSNKKWKKKKKYEGFPMNLNNQRVKLDLPVTQKTKPKQSKKESKTN
jgi:hypothetical protein